MEKYTSIKIDTKIANKAKKVKERTGVSIGKQFEMAWTKAYDTSKKKGTTFP